MATLQPWSSLTLDQKVQYAKNVTMANSGVSQPNITVVNATNLNNLITAIQADIIAIKSLLTSSTLTSTGTSAYTTPIPFTSLPTALQTKLLQFVPPGYAPPAIISGQELVDIEQGVVGSLQALQTTQSILPKAGTGTSVQPLQAAAPAQAQPNNTLSTIATVAAVGLGAAALVNVISNKAIPAGIEVNLAQNAATTDETIQDKKVPADPNLAQNAATTDETIQDKKVPADPGGTANIQLQEQNAAANAEAIRNAGELGNQQGLTTAKLNTQSQATQQDAVNFQAKEDWRVRLSLSPGATYLYKASPPGILAPLQATDGVIFPYTPAISVQYNANYDATELTHSNYKFFTYRGSAVDSVTIGCDFTAQDTFEAQYVLAVIHFFRSMTKMFYGQDQNPTNGTPPPLCYLSGLGAFQFDAHPLVITAFTYTLPTDVDYIQAGSNFTPAGVNTAGSESKQDPFPDAISRRLASNASNALSPGATVAPTVWQTTNSGTKEATYVPTKISLSITANPIVTRNDISNKFSLREYATGALLRGTKRAGGGIW